MVKDTFEDCQDCMIAVGAQLYGYSTDILKIVLLALLRDVLVSEATSAAMLTERADQAAAFIKQGVAHHV
jgi:hypothetical protein